MDKQALFNCCTGLAEAITDIDEPLKALSVAASLVQVSGLECIIAPSLKDAE